MLCRPLRRESENAIPTRVTAHRNPTNTVRRGLGVVGNPGGGASTALQQVVASEKP
jgi:hypothetical protein